MFELWNLSQFLGKEDTESICEPSAPALSLFEEESLNEPFPEPSAPDLTLLEEVISKDEENQIEESDTCSSEICQNNIVILLL